MVPDCQTIYNTGIISVSLGAPLDADYRDQGYVQKICHCQHAPHRGTQRHIDMLLPLVHHEKYCRLSHKISFENVSLPLPYERYFEGGDRLDYYSKIRQGTQPSFSFTIHFWRKYRLD